MSRELARAMADVRECAYEFRESVRRLLNSSRHSKPTKVIAVLAPTTRVDAVTLCRAIAALTVLHKEPPAHWNVLTSAIISDVDHVLLVPTMESVRVLTRHFEPLAAITAEAPEIASDDEYSSSSSFSSDEYEYDEDEDDGFIVNDVPDEAAPTPCADVRSRMPSRDATLSSCI